MSKIIILYLCLLGNFSNNSDFSNLKPETLYQKAIKHSTISLYDVFVVVKIRESKSPKEKEVCIKSKNLIEAIRAENQYIINNEQAIEILLALEGEIIRFKRKKALKILEWELQSNRADIKIIADSIQNVIELTGKWTDIIPEKEMSFIAYELTKRGFLVGQGVGCRNNDFLKL